MLVPDTTIQNRYRIVYAVDQRPEGQLYRARDEQSGRLVLLGVLPSGDNEQLQQLQQAAKLLAGLSHATILPVLDHFVEGASFYLVCEDAGGQDMERVLRGNAGPLAEAQVLSRASELLEGLEMLHSQRPPFYLGDLQLTDLWIVDGGAWRLAPLLLLRPISQAPSPYRAPELISGDVEPSAASDTYAISAMLYHLLCGWPPPTAEQRQARMPLNPPTTMNPNLSALAEQAVLRGLQENPRNRYQNARELRLALDTVRMMVGRSLGLGPDVLAAPTLPSNYAPPSGYPQQPQQPAATQPQPGGYSPQQPQPQPGGYPPQPYPGAYAAAAPAQRGLSTGCLVAIAVSLTLLAIGFAVLLVLLFFTPLGRSLIGQRGASSAPVATSAPLPTTQEPSAPAATGAPQPTSGAPLPTLEPSNLGPSALTLQNVGQITSTTEITSDVSGPVSFSPDGKLLALGISTKLSIRPADLSSGGSALSGHTGLVGSLAWSPDGKLLASGAVNDPVIRIWDSATNTQVRELRGHTGWIRSLAWSPDGKLLASGSTDLSIRLWDPTTGQVVQTLTGHTGILGGVAFSPDSTSLASGARDGSVRLWDVATGKERPGFEFRMPLDQNSGLRLWTTGVAFSPDGKQIAVGAIDGAVHLLDAASGKELRALTGHTDWVVIRGLAWAPDGKTLFSASLDGTIRAWNPETGQQFAQFVGHQLRITGIALSPDGQRMASTSNEDGAVYLWNVADQKILGLLRIGQGLITSLNYAPDGQTLGSTGANGTIQIYQLARQRGQLLSGSVATSQPLAFLKNNQVALISDQQTLALLDSGAQGAKQLTGLDGPPVCVIAGPNGSQVIAGSATGAIAIWSTSQPDKAQTLRGQLKLVRSLALSSDGALLAAAGSVADAGQPENPLIELWDLKSGKVIQSLRNSGDRIISMAFQPRGGLLAMSDRGGELRVWRAADGTLVRTVNATPDEQRYAGLAFSPDGTMLAGAALNGDLIFWDAGTGEEAARVPLTQGVPIALAFSPNGEQLAVSVRNETTSVIIFALPRA